jgi:hypothetical protein
MPIILNDAKEKMIFQSDGHYVIAQWKTIKLQETKPQQR